MLEKVLWSLIGILLGLCGLPASAVAEQLYLINDENRVYLYADETWVEIDNTGNTVSLTGTNTVAYQLNEEGQILRYMNTPCTASVCVGWDLLDNNSRTAEIVADNERGTLYQRHDTGWIWVHDGSRCGASGCTGWRQLDRNPRTKMIAAGGGNLYQLHDNGNMWIHTGEPCNATACPGWTLIDNNANTKKIFAAGNRLVQLHNNGAIWEFTGQQCGASGCTGWRRLDTNPNTKDLALTRNQLYQIHTTGWVWRYTGRPCNSTDGCAGWEQWDRNPAGFEIAAAGGALYQMHRIGETWRSTGRRCAGENCPGWRMLGARGTAVSAAADMAVVRSLRGGAQSLYVFGRTPRNNREKAIAFCNKRMGEDLLPCDVQSGVCTVGMTTIKRFKDGPGGSRNYRACRDKNGPERLKRLGNALAPMFGIHTGFNYASYRSYMKVIDNHAGPKTPLPRETWRTLQPFYTDVNLQTVRIAHSTSGLVGDGCIADCNTIYCVNRRTIQSWRDGNINQLLTHELEHAAQCARWGGRTMYGLRWFRNLDVSLIRAIRNDAAAPVDAATRVHDRMPMEEKAEEKAIEVCDAIPDC